MTDNFNVSWPVTWSEFARKQIFIPKRLDSMFGRALVPGWRPFMNRVYLAYFFPPTLRQPLIPTLPHPLALTHVALLFAHSFLLASAQSLLSKTLTQPSTPLCFLCYINMRQVPDSLYQSQVYTARENKKNMFYTFFPFWLSGRKQVLGNPLALNLLPGLGCSGPCH